ncbi:MAG: hypothetical protein ACOC4Y_01820 [bacterium]
MEFEEIKQEYKEVLEKLAELTGTPIKDIEKEINNAEDIDELLKRATEIFDI